MSLKVIAAATALGIITAGPALASDSHQQESDGVESHASKPEALQLSEPSRQEGIDPKPTYQSPEASGLTYNFDECLLGNNAQQPQGSALGNQQQADTQVSKLELL